VRPRPTPPSSRAKYLMRVTLEGAECVASEPAGPRARYLRLLQAWVECRPHQPAKRRFIEGALARARRQAIREVLP
jgi:hypothetical protein